MEKVRQLAERLDQIADRFEETSNRLRIHVTEMNTHELLNTLKEREGIVLELEKTTEELKEILNQNGVKTLRELGENSQVALLRQKIERCYVKNAEDAIMISAAKTICDKILNASGISQQTGTYNSRGMQQ